ncbi:MAG: GTPase Era [Bacteroidetes bacterium]|nr:GTPase Era [Bacteroidota bacterium]
MKSGFVNIFGKPNAGKSTLMNALLGEKLAIVSHKSQTTRQRIKGFINNPGIYQIVLSDTPGILDEPKYKLHEKMLQQVKNALEDADVALLLVDANSPVEEAHELFLSLNLSVPILLVINKIDKVSKEKLDTVTSFFSSQLYGKNIMAISALQQQYTNPLLDKIIELLPEGAPYFPEDELTDLPVKFFCGEMIREKIFELYQEEIPYDTAIVVNEFKEKETLIKIQADIIVQRESQKGIILGEKGNRIKELGTSARIEIEKFLQQKVFLQLFVRVRPGWRDNETYLKEYGYH